MSLLAQEAKWTDPNAQARDPRLREMTCPVACVLDTAVLGRDPEVG